MSVNTHQHQQTVTQAIKAIVAPPAHASASAWEGYYGCVSRVVALFTKAQQSPKRRLGGAASAQEETPDSRATEQAPKKMTETPPAAPPLSKSKKRKLRKARLAESRKQAPLPRPKPEAPRKRINAAKAALLELKVEKLTKKKFVGELEQVARASSAKHDWQDIGDDRFVCKLCERRYQYDNDMANFYLPCSGQSFAATPQTSGGASGKLLAPAPANQRGAPPRAKEAKVSRSREKRAPGLKQVGAMGGKK